MFYLLSDNTDKRNTGSPLVRMSRDWVEDRGPKERAGLLFESASRDKRHDRRTVFVTFESSGPVQHGEALVDINMGLAVDKVQPHTEHGVTDEWSTSEIDSVVAARKKAFKAREAAKAQTAEPASDKPKSVKTRKSKSKS